MVSKFSQFLIYLILFSLILFVGWELLHEHVPIKYQYPHVKYIILFYAIITALFHFGAVRTNQNSGAGFMRFYVAATTFKLLLLLGIMIIYALMFTGNALPFIIYFFAGYLLYTTFETTIIFKYLK